MKASKRVLCVISLLSLMLLAGCGRKSEPALVTGPDGTADNQTTADGADGSGTDQEIHIYSDTQAGSFASPETIPEGNGSRTIIQDQSFNVELDGWGSVRFVSCEPEDSLDTPHFYLMKDNQILYTFPWEDKTGTPGVFDSVRFVSFPDIDKDGKKDVIIGVGKMFQNTDSHIPYSVVSIYLNRGNGFDTADSLTSRVNEAVMNGETEYKEVSALVEKFMKEPSGSAAGSWTLNGPKTEAGLKQYGSLQEMFGTGLHLGNGLEISEAGDISYYIGIGVGGKGQCAEADVSAESGGTITAAITPYEGHSDSQNSLTLHLISEDNTQYLTMEYGGEILYWSR